ncbi:MAG: ABC transporter permease subunit/CPBP intramembrane protease [Myxococcota bacterium]
MSPLSAAAVITRKELREALRDRKTLVVMVVLPLVLYPLLFIGFSQATMVQRDRLVRQAVVVGVEDGPAPAGLRGELEAIEGASIEAVADAAEAVIGGRVDVAVRVPETARLLVATEGQTPLTVVFDGSADLSREAEQRVRGAVAGWVESVRRDRLDGAGLLPEFVDPVALESDNVAPPARQGGWILGQILPMLVSFLMIGAAFYPAVDLTAGEKERGTLQTLLTAPIPPLAIVAGKFGAVVGLSVLSGIVNLGSVALVAVSLPLPEQLGADVSFAVSPGSLVLIFLCLVLLGMMFGAVMMAVAVTARTFKDAQNYLTPLYLVCVFPLMISSLPGVALGAGTAALPVVNLALAMKALLLGEVEPGLLLVVLLSTAAWTALGLVLAARVFTMESVLLGQEGPGALFRRRTRADRRSPVPTVGEAITLLALVLLLLFYGSLALADAPLLAIIHTTQWLFLLAPAAGLALALRLDIRATFALRRPPAWSVAAAVLLGGGLWYGALRVMETLADHWLPVPTPQMEAMGEAFARLGGAPDTAAILFLGAAVAPAVCEEALFRGVLLQSLLRRASPAVAVLASSAVFALYHLNIHQLPTTFGVGLVLGGLVVLSGSVWPAVILHMMHNGMALASQLYGNPEVLRHPAMFALLAAPAAGVALMVRAARRRP